MVDAYRFAPLGQRSIAGGYPQFGFAAASATEVVTALNDATLVVVMLETPQAIENADKIAAVPGIDALLMGTNDLCLEMGIPGQIDIARVVAAVDTVVAACRKHGKWPGLGGVYGKELHEAIHRPRHAHDPGRQRPQLVDECGAGSGGLRQRLQAGLRRWQLRDHPIRARHPSAIHVQGEEA